MENRYILFIYFLCLVSSSRAQSTASVKGTVLSANDKPVAYANVILKPITAPDSIKLELSNEQGYFEFDQLRTNEYWLEVSFVGLPTYISDTFHLADGANLQLPQIQLAAPDNELVEVEVIGKKPLIELKPDKIVFNVAGTINATGSNALQMLRKSPGVFINSNDDIRLAGVQSVMIYLDDKPIPIKGRDLASFLRTIQASEIEKIEIISNPSSKYDAEGSGGIINIILKKDKSLGTNANSYFGYSIGEFPWYNLNQSLNFRNKKINFFGGYSYSLGSSITNSRVSRRQNEINIDQTNRSVSDWKSHNLKAGMDIYLNKASTLGFQLKGFFTDYGWMDLARSPIQQAGQNLADSLLVTEYDIEGRRNNLIFNANYHLRNDRGTTLILDVDYGSYQNPVGASQSNTFFDAPQQQVLSGSSFETENPTEIDVLGLKADLERNLWGGQLGSGLKFTNTQTDNHFDFFDIINAREVFNYNRSQQFEYTEKVSAAYASFQRSLKQFSIKIGLRTEYTQSLGNLTAFSPNKDDLVKRDYLDLFPSAGLSLQIDTKNSFQLNYSRRIKRPSFNNLNPFINPLDELTAEQGNPYLKPEYTNKIQLTHGFNYQIYTTLSFSRTTDLIIRVGEISDVAKTTFRLRNLSTQNNYSLNTSISHQLTNWWSTYNNVTIYHVRNQANFGSDQIVDIKGTSLYIYSQQSISLPADFSLEIYGWYNSPGVSGANTRSNALGSLDIGLQKKLWGKRARINISFSDVFRTNRWRSVSDFDDIHFISSGYWDSRRMNIGLSYSFGNQQLKKVKDRTDLEEENRISTDDKEQRRKRG